jgi:hypothetical protein
MNWSRPPILLNLGINSIEWNIRQPGTCIEEEVLHAC